MWSGCHPARSVRMTPSPSLSPLSSLSVQDLLDRVERLGIAALAEPEQGLPAHVLAAVRADHLDERGHALAVPQLREGEHRRASRTVLLVMLTFLGSEVLRVAGERRRREAAEPEARVGARRARAP